MSASLYARAALVCTFLLSLAAPDATAQRRGRDDDTFGRRGAAALSFSASWLSVGPFLGGAGGRYWLSDRTVLTGTVGLGASDRDIDDEGRESRGFRTGLGLGLEQHFGRSRRVSPFVAVGVEGGYEELRDTFVPPDPGAPTVEREQRAGYVGGALYVGAEYRFAPSLTLAAAHQLGVAYRRGEQANRGGGADLEEDFSEIVAGTSTTALVLSVYF